MTGYDGEMQVAATADAPEWFRGQRKRRKGPTLRTRSEEWGTRHTYSRVKCCAGIMRRAVWSEPNA